jgi:8-oxo-dGTP pyrophosphatase MutT (NUDIX family)
MAEDKLFFVGQKAFIEKGGKLLVLFDQEDKVDFPGGKIQEGENDFKASLLREVKEETDLVADVGDPFIVWSFDLPEHHPHAGKTVFLVGYKCDYRGGELKLSDEHLRYQWMGKEDTEHLNVGDGHSRALRKYFARH